jgi:hypothetical protein
VGEDRAVACDLVLLREEAVELARVDLERVGPPGLDQRRDERQRVGEVHVVVGGAVDQQQVGLERAGLLER